MPVQRLNGLPSAYDIGQGTGDFIAKAADAAANTACGLYRDYPGFVLPPDVFNLTPGVTAAARGLWDSLCGGRGALPVPPEKPYLGGQCKCKSYRFSTESKSRASQTTPNTSTSTAFIGRIFIKETVNPDGLALTEVFQQPCSGGVESGAPVLRSRMSYFVNDGGYAKITSVQSVVGADTCGDPVPRYPPALAPTSRTTGNTVINNNDGTDITIPFVYAPVSISPEFSPQIRVDLGGLNFRFDLGGVDVQFPPLAPSPPGRPELPTPGGNNAPPPDCPECPPAGGSDPAPGDPELEPVEPPPGEEGEVDAPEVKFLEVNLTKLPNKLQFGGQGKNVYFAGWIAFRAKSGSYYPRQQIHFKDSIFKAPDGADGFTYTFTNFAEGTVRFYTEKSTTP